MKSRAFLIFVPLAIVLSTLLRPPPAAAVGPWAGGWFRAAAAAASPIQRRGAASSEPWDDQRHQAEDVCPIYPAFPDPAPKGARVPGFLIVGAQKGGTTFLHNVLSELPGVSGPTVQPAFEGSRKGLPPIYKGITKELHFFDRANLNNHSLEEEYLPAWEGVPDGSILFESSPGYLPTPMAPQRISKVLPGVKIIMMLREPSSRAFSHWNMRQTFCQRKDKRINCPQDFNTDMEQEIMALRQTGCSLHKLSPSPDAWNKCFRCYFEASCDFTEGVDTRSWFYDSVDAAGPRAECKQWSSHAGYVFRGMYAPQIAWWLQFFSPTQLYVINQDDLASKPEEVLRGVVSFLGLDVPEDLIKLKAKEKAGRFRGNYSNNDKLNGEGKEVVNKAMQRLKTFFSVHNANLYRLLAKAGVKGFTRFGAVQVPQQVLRNSSGVDNLERREG